MECMNCHEMNEEGNKFCNNCGTELVKKEVTNTQVEEPKPVETPVTPIVTSNTSKKSSNVVVIVIVGVVSVILVGILAFFGVRAVINSYQANNEISGKIDTNTNSNTNNNSYNNNENDYNYNKPKTQVVGKDKYGYVTIPSDWVPFKDPSVSIDLVQYTNGEDFILTMNYYDKTEVPSAMQAASNIKSHLASENVEGLTGATVKMGSYDAYQVYGYYPDDDLWLVCWLFDGNDGYIHYLAIEGSDHYSDFFDIPNTFREMR